MTFNLTAFERVLDPADNATGGGAASAVSGAMGAALVGMVARLSIGKKNMSEPDEYYEKRAEYAEALATALMDGSNADSAAFDKVMEAFRLPRETEEEKIARSAAIQVATMGATETPLQNAERCGQVLELAASLAGKSNKNAASDLDCAVYLATAGLKGALSNAEINIDSLKDEAVVETFRVRVGMLREIIKA